LTSVNPGGGGVDALRRAARERLRSGAHAIKIMASGGVISGRAAIGLAREAGVRIGFGTDLMGALDDEQLHGLRLQAEVEGPLALLRAATSVNAELLGRDDLGQIGPGAAADLLVLDGDPLQDPSVLWGGPDRRAVFQGGIRMAEQDARLAL
jgi:imidazolonepropionase-like amidohydrolase